MNLSKELKKKRDAEDRLRQSSPQKVFFPDGFIDLSQFANKNHTHKFIDLTDVPDNYIADKFVKVNAYGTALEYGDGGGGGISEIPQATESVLGGIKAAEKTSGETQEVKIDNATGKLYSTPPTQAQNGLPAGGTTGQIPIKNSDNDYDCSWGDVPSGGEGEPNWANGIGEKRIFVTATAYGGSSGNPINSLGAAANNNFYWSTGNTTKVLKFEFPKQNKLTGMAIFQSNTTSNGIWTLAGSNNDIDYTDIINDYVLGGTPYSPYITPTIPVYCREFENDNQYKYYRLTLNSENSTSNSPYVNHFLFKCEPIV